MCNHIGLVLRNQGLTCMAARRNSLGAKEIQYGVAGRLGKKSPSRNNGATYYQHQLSETRKRKHAVVQTGQSVIIFLLLEYSLKNSAGANLTYE